MWNVKAIQVKSNTGLHGGKPDIMYFFPEVCNKTNYLVPVNQNDVMICKNLYGQSASDYSVEFEDLVNLILPEVVTLETADEGIALFQQIIQLIDEL